MTTAGKYAVQETPHKCQARQNRKNERPVDTNGVPRAVGDSNQTPEAEAEASKYPWQSAGTQVVVLL